MSLKPCFQRTLISAPPCHDSTVTRRLLTIISNFSTSTEDDKHTEARTATIPNKFHRTEVESISDSDEEGVLLLEVDDEEEWEVLGAARSIPK